MTTIERSTGDGLNGDSDDADTDTAAATRLTVACWEVHG